MSNPIKLDTLGKVRIELTLEKALLIGAKANLVQKGLLAKTNSDKWFIGTVFSDLLPDVYLSNSGIFRDGDNFVDPTTGVPIASRKTYLTSGTILGIVSPETPFATVAAYYDFVSSSSNYAENSQELLRQIANQYYDLIRAKAELKIRQEAINLARAQVQLSQDLIDGGAGTRFSQLQAIEQLKDFERDLYNQEGAARIAELELMTLLNLPLESELVLLDGKISKKPLQVIDSRINEFIEASFKLRPKIKQKAYEYKAAKTRIKQAYMRFAPTLNYSLETIGSKTNWTQSLNPTDQDDFQNIAVGLNWQILDGLGLGQLSAIKQRSYEAQAASMDLLQERLTTQKEVRVAYVAIYSNEEQIKAAEEQLKASIEGISQSKIRFRNGIGSTLDVIDSQQNYVNALINKVRGITKFNQSHVDLMRASGNINIKNLSKDSANLKI